MAQLLILVLNQEELLDDVLSAFMEVGISGATIIDSVGMGRVLSYDVPIFAGLRQMIQGQRPYNKTIFTVIKDEHKIDEIIQVVEQICSSLDEPGTGLIFAVPITMVKGMAKEA